jgi:hypothetical protein
MEHVANLTDQDRLVLASNHSSDLRAKDSRISVQLEAAKRTMEAIDALGQHHRSAIAGLEE